MLGGLILGLDAAYRGQQLRPDFVHEGLCWDRAGRSRGVNHHQGKAGAQVYRHGDGIDFRAPVPEGADAAEFGQIRLGLANACFELQPAGRVERLQPLLQRPTRALRCPGQVAAPGRRGAQRHVRAYAQPQRDDGALTAAVLNVEHG